VEGFGDPEKADLSKASARNGKVLSDQSYVCFPDGTLSRWISSAYPGAAENKVLMSTAAPFLLTNPDFSWMEAVKAYAHTIVTPAL
jgi:hypothetical protein